jgi:thioredoxin-dependent peroxiredoxin
VTKPQAGAPAPDFSSLDESGTAVTLRDFRGRWVALFFYPKDDTPG